MVAAYRRILDAGCHILEGAFPHPGRPAILGQPFPFLHSTPNTTIMKTLTTTLAMPLLVAAFHATHAQPVLQEHWWQGFGTYFQINTSVMDEPSNTLYLGGDFYLNSGGFMPPVTTAHGAVLDANGEGWPGLGHDVPNGSVLVAIPDGSGGWFVGGGFTNMGAHARQQLARLNANGTVNTAWDANGNVGVQGGDVQALLIHNGVLYVAGSFTSAGGAARARLAAFDVATGMLTSWSTGLGCDNSVRALAMGDGVLYAGGNFTTAGGQPRQSVAALDLASGVATAWAPQIVGGWVNTLAFADAQVYLGGTFVQVNGTSRNRIAAIEAGTGTLSPWNPGASNHPVNVIRISGDTAYVGGEFISMGGANRKGLAALSRSVNTNNALAWNPMVSGGNVLVYCMTVRSSGVFIGGLFFRAGTDNAYRRYAACIDRNTGEALSWDPSADGNVRTIGDNGTDLYAGGDFQAIGFRRRSDLAAIDITTGKPTTWWSEGHTINNDNGGVVHALAQKGDTLIVGGNFTTVDGQPRQNIAALSKSTGELLNWQVNANGQVNALAVVGNILYVGGQFTEVNGISRHRLAAVDIAAASVILPWQANVSGGGAVSVDVLHVSNGLLYLGGKFTSVGTEQRELLAAVGLATGQVAPFAPSVSGFISGSVFAPSINVIETSISGDTVFIGGHFTSVSGVPRQHLAAVNATTSTALNNWICDSGGGWPPGGVSAVTALLRRDAVLYTGVPYELAGQPTQGIGAVAIGSSDPVDWDPGISPTSDWRVRTILRTGNLLIAGGNFAVVADGTPKKGLAAWSGMNAFEASIDINTGLRSPSPATNEIGIAPNPTTGQFTLHLPQNAQPRVLAVLDATGRTVLVQSIANTSSPITMDLGNLGNSLYFVHVTFADGTRAVERVVKE